MKGNEKILLIDDNQDQLLVVSHAIAEATPTLKVVMAKSESEVFEVLQNREVLPKIVLLDLYMPRKEDGLRILATIKQQLKEQKRPAVPVVLTLSK